MQGILAQTDWVVASAAWATAIAAFVYTLFTIWLVSETRRMRQVYTDPCVVVFIRKHATEDTLLELVIRNIGSGMARNITFGLPQGLQTCLWGIGVESLAPGEPVSRGALVQGIPALAPNQERAILWGQWKGIEKHLLTWANPEIRASFFGADLRTSFETKNPIEIASFDGLSLAPDNPIASVSKELKSLNAEIRALRNHIERAAIKL